MLWQTKQTTIVGVGVFLGGTFLKYRIKILFCDVQHADFLATAADRAKKLIGRHGTSTVASTPASRGRRQNMLGK